MASVAEQRKKLYEKIKANPVAEQAFLEIVEKQIGCYGEGEKFYDKVLELAGVRASYAAIGTLSGLAGEYATAQWKGELSEKDIERIERGKQKQRENNERKRIETDLPVEQAIMSIPETKKLLDDMVNIIVSENKKGLTFNKIRCSSSIGSIENKITKVLVESKEYQGGRSFDYKQFGREGIGYWLDSEHEQSIFRIAQRKVESMGISDNREESNLFSDIEKSKREEVEAKEFSGETIIDELRMSPRAYNSLRRNNVNTVDDMFNLSEEDFTKFRNLGAKTKEEIYAMMDKLTKPNPPQPVVRDEKKEKLSELTNVFGQMLNKANKPVGEIIKPDKE